MEEHGGGVEVGRGGRLRGKDDAPELLGRVEKKIRNNSSLVGDKMTLFAAKQAAVGQTNGGVRRSEVLESVPEILVQGLTLVVIPSVHRTPSRSRWCIGAGRGEEGLECGFPDCR